jgi:hypothetical protein
MLVFANSLTNLRGPPLSRIHFSMRSSTKARRRPARSSGHIDHCLLPQGVTHGAAGRQVHSRRARVFRDAGITLDLYPKRPGKCGSGVMRTSGRGTFDKVVRSEPLARAPMSQFASRPRIGYPAISGSRRAG